MSAQRVLDAIIITCAGVLCAAFLIDDFFLGLGAAFIGGGAAILDDIIRK